MGVGGLLLWGLPLHPVNQVSAPSHWSQLLQPEPPPAEEGEPASLHLHLPSLQGWAPQHMPFPSCSWLFVSKWTQVCLSVSENSTVIVTIAAHFSACSGQGCAKHYMRIPQVNPPSSPMRSTMECCLHLVTRNWGSERLHKGQDLAPWSS